MTVNSNAALASHRENARIQCHPVKTLPGSSAGIHFAVLRPSVGSPGECLFFQLLDIMCKVEPSIYIYNVFRFSTLCTKHCFTSLSMIGYLRWKFCAFRFGFYFCHFLLHLLCSDFQWHLCVSFLSMSLLNHSSEKIYICAIPYNHLAEFFLHCSSIIYHIWSQTFVNFVSFVFYTSCQVQC